MQMLQRHAPVSTGAYLVSAPGAQCTADQFSATSQGHDLGQFWLLLKVIRSDLFKHLPHAFLRIDIRQKHVLGRIFADVVSAPGQALIVEQARGQTLGQQGDPVGTWHVLHQTIGIAVGQNLRAVGQILTQPDMLVIRLIQQALHQRKEYVEESIDLDRKLL